MVSVSLACIIVHESLAGIVETIWIVSKNAYRHGLTLVLDLEVV